MFICRGCLRRLAGFGTSPFAPRLLGSLQRTTGPITSRRTYLGKGIKVDLRSALAQPLEQEAPHFIAKRKSEQSAIKEHALDEDDGDLAYENVNAKGGDLGKQRYERKLQAAVKKQLSLAEDPYHIAQHVSRALERGSFDEALLMARMASRNKKVEVSWNHLIDYQMKNRRLHAAVKLYNEMKKRAQIPNAKTYTIIFRGCALSLHPKLAVSEATRIYNFMVKQGALKPNTIHMNAVLEVCARAGDLESLFTVLSTANGNLRSPDAHTYTIVLNALRHDVSKMENSNLGLVDAEVRREMQKNIQRARAIWSDVVANWRNAKLILDEHLVFAMGRILTAGDYKDNESVLLLLEQTMRLPRFDKPNVQLPAPFDPSSTTGLATLGDQIPNTSNMSAKARKELATSRANSSPLYAKPGNKTLSLVLTVLTNTRKTSSAPKYWSYLTQTVNITPDAENYYVYLRTLAAGHASAQVANLVTSMPSTLLSPLTFRRAFTACIDDNLNKEAFGHACRIFDDMTARTRYPDALAMRLFLQVARASTRHFHEAKPDEYASVGGGKRAHGAQILAALDRMWEPFRILSGSLSYPSPEATTTGMKTARSPQEELECKRGDMQEILATARRMIAGIDRVLNEGNDMCDLKAQKLWRVRRIVLQKAVERWIRKIYPDGRPLEERQTVLDEDDSTGKPITIGNKRASRLTSENAY
ncbi:hypothetical protein N657DRAFT_597007 [Parathielavia appendiculata]|uniref:Pentatricopeptide repeat protein n=1 Tax=Parathielavia appendiculata TaxID=2587402 RepID=A0AAN6Z3Z4_9PEZI|nr:hypothetical protein N657DRAFT_597007 [Parathielavia appendiculata]